MSSTQYKPGEKGNPENGLVCFGGVCRGKGWCSWRCWRESWNHAAPLNGEPMRGMEGGRTSPAFSARDVAHTQRLRVLPADPLRV